VSDEEKVEEMPIETVEVGLRRLDASTAVWRASETRIGAKDVAGDLVGVDRARIGSLSIVGCCEKGGRC
jgi:hypothetical protein